MHKSIRNRVYDGDSFDGETVPAPKPVFNTEEYKSITANPFLSAKEQSLSTFGADVDTASWASRMRLYIVLPVRHGQYNSKVIRLGDD